MPDLTNSNRNDSDTDGKPNAERGRIRASRSRRGLRSVAPAVIRLTMLGWFVATSIALGALMGWWLDGRLGTEPWLLVAGVLLGVGAAMVGMVRMLQDLP